MDSPQKWESLEQSVREEYEKISAGLQASFSTHVQALQSSMLELWYHLFVKISGWFTIFTELDCPTTWRF
jgi:hypothetical protein